MLSYASRTFGKKRLTTMMRKNKTLKSTNTHSRNRQTMLTKHKQKPFLSFQHPQQNEHPTLEDHGNKQDALKSMWKMRTITLKQKYSTNYGRASKNLATKHLSSNKKQGSPQYDPNGSLSLSI
jgi:hypothetical protein